MGRIRALFESLKHLSEKHRTSEEYYTQIRTDIACMGGTNEKTWMNVGYWKTADNYNQACEDLARLLSEAGHFSNKTTLLDVGCGCGEQDLFWQKLYPGLKIHAVDITPLHIEIANERAEKAGSDIRFSLGNATNLPAEDGSVSCVSALDCAYHFDPRVKFMEEAYRVLEPGGEFVASEMLPQAGDVYGRKDQIEGRQSLFMPEVNVVTAEEYAAQLEKIGFVDVKCTKIGPYVYKGLTCYYLARLLHADQPIDKVKVKFNHNRWQPIYTKVFQHMYGTREYDLITARKPGKGEAS